MGTAYEASIHWRRKAGYHDPEARFGWAALPVVAETWDGRLNDIHGHHVKPEHVFHALNEAKPGKVEEGNVGGGTGMVCHGFKGGIGTASRLLENTYTLGALVQANYGKRENLTIAGLPVGHHLEGREMEIHGRGPLDPGHSIIVIIATDAPLLPHQLKRGKPHYIRSDNGSEFIARDLQAWFKKVGIKSIQIYPGSPWENGYNERFNGTLRKEALNAEWFSTIKQAQIVINTWLRQHNHLRPHQSLNIRPPVPETLHQNGT